MAQTNLSLLGVLLITFFFHILAYLIVTVLLNWFVAERKDIRTSANCKDTDRPAHPYSLVRIFAVHLHNIDTYQSEDIGLIAKS